MKRAYWIATGFLITGVASMLPASASYMKTCNGLIEKWNTCQESESDCSEQTKVIEETCKCHAQKGDEWKLIQAAVAKDDVCGKPPQDITLPPPPPPPARPIVKDPNKPAHPAKKEERG